MARTMERPLFILLAAILAFTLTFAAVPITAHAEDGTAGKETEPINAHSVLIVITAQPAANLIVTEKAIAGSLTCEAAVSPEGVPTYLWYQCGDLSKSDPVSSGATGTRFTIPATLTEGTYYYYCEVGAMDAETVCSDVATITVQKPPHDRPPSIPATNTGTPASFSAAGTHTTTGTGASPTYTVVYDINGGDMGYTASSNHTYGVAQNLTMNSYFRMGYSFGGWATEPTGPKVYDDGQSVMNLTDVDGSTVTLYAVWIQNPCTISFDTGSEGPSMTPVTMTPGGTIDTPPKPVWTGHVFCGWYFDEECTMPVTFPYTVTIDCILHAKWAATDFITDIIISGGTLAPSFDPGVKIYTVTLGEATSTYKVDVVKANSNNKVYMDGQPVKTGKKYSLKPGGKHAVNIRVDTPAHKTTTYTITFTRPKSTNANLAKLSASFYTYTIQPAFDKNVTNYVLRLPVSRAHVVVKAKTDSGYAILSINGRIAKTKNIKLKRGMNTITIIVKAQAGNMKKYTITVIRGPIKPPAS